MQKKLEKVSNTCFHVTSYVPFVGRPRDTGRPTTDVENLICDGYYHGAAVIFYVSASAIIFIPGRTDLTAAVAVAYTGAAAAAAQCER